MNKPSFFAMLGTAPWTVLAMFLLSGVTVKSQAQAVGRIRQQANRAVSATQAASGGQNQPGTPGHAPASPPADPKAAARIQAQLAAQQAALAKRNKENLVGADQRVVQFLKQRVDEGSGDAAYDLAKRYEEGKGVEADPDEARRLYFLAEERGNLDAKAWLTEHPGESRAALEARKSKASSPSAAKVTVPQKKPEATATAPAK